MSDAISAPSQRRPVERNTFPLDLLPGIKTDKPIRARANARRLFGSKDLAQSAQQNADAGLLETIKTDIAKLAGLRRKIQLAADQAQPYRATSVASICTAFLLPKDRPLTDRRPTGPINRIFG